jgi:hypothetical protein
VKYVQRRHKPKFDIWPIVYIDLMTQIMMFFVILWSISQMQAKKRGASKTLGDTTLHEVTLPGDVLFPSGKTKLTPQGEEVFAKLFKDDTGEVLSFETGGLTRRVLVVHGHTDSDGKKRRHVPASASRPMIQCGFTPRGAVHARDNTPGTWRSGGTATQRRRSPRPRPGTAITIEDQVTSAVKQE